MEERERRKSECLPAERDRTAMRITRHRGGDRRRRRRRRRPFSRSRRDYTAILDVGKYPVSKEPPVERGMQRGRRSKPPRCRRDGGGCNGDGDDDVSSSRRREGVGGTVQGSRNGQGGGEQGRGSAERQRSAKRSWRHKANISATKNTVGFAPFPRRRRGAPSLPFLRLFLLLLLLS